MCCNLIYTSGTTGNPKGVMLSHDNLVWGSHQFAHHTSIISRGPENRVVSYLPLSHIAGLQFDVINPLLIKHCEIFFAKPDAMQGTLVESLKWGRPTAFFAVPRIWEKLELAIREKMLLFSDDEKKLGEWAMAYGKQHVLALEAKTQSPSLFGVANSIFLRKMKASVGLDQCESFYFGAAALKQQTSDFFTSLDIPLFNLYGLSETTGNHVLHNFSKFNLQTSGFSMPGTQTKIDNPDENGDGEILLRGRQTMMGYLNNEKATIATLTSDGFLRTGDRGRLNPEGFLQITGRIKELIITAGGENIAPVGVEDKFKLQCPPCSNIMLVGEGQRFLGALITFKVDIDPKTGIPTRNLMLEAREFFKQELGLTISTSDQAIAEPKVQAYIEQCVKETNKRAISRAANIRKFHLLPDDFSIPGEELTPTLKLRRNVTSAKYKTIIDKMFAEAKL